MADGKLYVDQVRQSSRTPVVSLLVHGPAGAGKTAIAATIALESEFPFIKLISPETMVGMSESAKIAEITKVKTSYYIYTYTYYTYVIIRYIDQKIVIIIFKTYRSLMIHTNHLVVLLLWIILNV